MRRDAGANQPTEELARAIGRISGKTFGLEPQALVSPLDHGHLILWRQIAAPRVNLFHWRKFMTRRHFTVTILVWALLALRDATPSLADDTGKLIGTWKLVSAVSEELATGQKTNIYKGTPIGFITYGADGRVMTIIVDSPRKKPSGAVATAVEAEALFRSMAAYAGTYTIEGNQVIHRPDVSWNETWTGTDQVREYKFDGERLILATSPSPNPRSGKMSVRSLVWEKIK
jgi:hypothetical protein